MTWFPFRHWNCLPYALCYIERLGVPDAASVFRFLLDYVKEHGWPCDIGADEIAKTLKMPKRRVANAIEDLKEFGVADLDSYTNTLNVNWRGLRNLEFREQKARTA